MTSTTAADPDGTARAELVEANRVLVAESVLDAFGHVSVRAPSDPGSFYLSRSLAPALVTGEDLQLLSLDGTPGDARPSYVERFIHAAIYRRRPDVQAVVHSHSVAVIPFSVVNRPLRPVMHMAGFLPEETPVFDIREFAGEDSDLLVRSLGLGENLAEKLGDAGVVLMRGHGSVAVGPSLQEAVFRAVYTEVNAGVQAQAEALGSPTYLTRGEAAAAAASNASQVGRAWRHWVDGASWRAVER